MLTKPRVNPSHYFSHSQGRLLQEANPSLQLSTFASTLSNLSTIIANIVAIVETRGLDLGFFYFPYTMGLRTPDQTHHQILKTIRCSHFLPLLNGLLRQPLLRCFPGGHNLIVNQPYQEMLFVHCRTKRCFLSSVSSTITCLAALVNVLYTDFKLLN